SPAEAVHSMRSSGEDSAWRARGSIAPRAYLARKDVPGAPRTCVVGYLLDTETKRPVELDAALVAQRGNRLELRDPFRLGPPREFFVQGAGDASAAVVGVDPHEVDVAHPWLKVGDKPQQKPHHRAVFLGDEGVLAKFVEEDRQWFGARRAAPPLVHHRHDL